VNALRNELGSPGSSVRRRSSRTAELMAVQRGLESCHSVESRLFSDPFAQEFVSGGWRLVLAAARIGVFRALLERLYDWRGGPGPRASAIARTRLIDDLIAEQAASVRQLVILGAGYDSRAYRLSALAGSTVFEVDHPDTQTSKQTRLARLTAAPISRVVFVPVDFERDDLARALHDAGYQPHAGSTFLWEGVTNYLSPGAVDTTLAAIRQLASLGSTLIFTYVDRAALDVGVATFPEAARWVSGVTRRGEPWTFGLEPATLASYLGNRGFTLVSDLSTAEAGERYFPPRHRSEHASQLYHVAIATTSQPV
jgi:methyltransferase (TIGR00027 family)